jgi:hypothetical protein
VAATFRENGCNSPLVDNDGKKCLFLERIISSFVKSDPAVQRQPALPLSVFRKLYNNRQTHLNLCLGQLAVAALFFGNRSCEYLKVDENEVNDRQTKILRLRNLVFRRNGQIIRSRQESELKKANTISVTYENQKNGEKMETITHRNSGQDICPVRVWSEIYARIINYSNATENSPVCTFCNNGNLFSLTSTLMRQRLRETVMEVGCDALGIEDATQVGTHSIRASFAMMLLLNKVQASTIMQMGRWKSDAFLVYIRKQVNTYGINISRKMFGTLSNNFFMIPHIQNRRADETTAQNHRRVKTRG